MGGQKPVYSPSPLKRGCRIEPQQHQHRRAPGWCEHKIGRCVLARGGPELRCHCLPVQDVFSLFESCAGPRPLSGTIATQVLRRMDGRVGDLWSKRRLRRPVIQLPITVWDKLNGDTLQGKHRTKSLYVAVKLRNELLLRSVSAYIWDR